MVPNCTRNAVINAAELASFDQIKETIVRNKWMEDKLPCHFVCSFFAGIIATLVGSPVDVIKARIMTADKSKGD